ncbi:hypothetical protein DPMN_184921 [Dreissena polymorpha]|uniref:G-protein coupled receptors family 1 profile domain-containing protein n=1 Tax=Dreissena polymorpha TaxID=45954 RepID=A0A9D4I6U1_DREPO|nr:hypothetical protein DPMN_184921 [Dreissena polymorpha]
MTEIRRAIERVRPNLRIARVYEMTELHTNFTVYDYDHEPSTTNASLDINGNPEEFQEFHAAVYILYGVYVLIVFLMGISQNTVTVVVFVREKRLHMMHNFFIIGLAVSDTGMCLCGHWMIVVSSFSYRWIFRRAGRSNYNMTYVQGVK